MLIGDLSKRSKLSHDTIRYYEKLGLLQAEALREPTSHYKQYPAAALTRLEHILLLKRCGFTLREIRGLLLSDGTRSVCKGLPEQLDSKVSRLDEKIAELVAYKALLLQTRQACSSDCGSTTGLPDCLELSTRALKGGACCA